MMAVLYEVRRHDVGRRHVGKRLEAGVTATRRHVVLVHAIWPTPAIVPFTLVVSSQVFSMVRLAACLC
jgi:hypothetical protein